MIATPVTPAVRTVHSADGTAISYHSVGTGPDVLVIPGALNDADDYSTLAETLAAHFTVHTVQRRGRAGSGPLGDNYSIDTECADLAAVRAATGARYVFGHSYGGLVALEAARHDPGITKLALYEPGVSVQGLFSTDWIPQYRRFLAQGRPFDAFAIFAIATGPAEVPDGSPRRSCAWRSAVNGGRRSSGCSRPTCTNTRKSAGSTTATPTTAICPQTSC